MSTVERVGVIGAGLMGSGIAEVAARAECDVVVLEADAEAAERGKRRVADSLGRAARSGRLEEAQRDVILSRLTFCVDDEALRDRQVVIEAIVEIEAAKLDVFRRLDKLVDDEAAILASNTSSIPIMKLGMATSRPEAVVGMHFFNPVPVLPLVELIGSLLSSADTLERADAFASHQLHKSVIRSQDRAGFVVNALLIPYLLSAIRMLESGFATADDIDRGMVEGCAHPLGPLHLVDLIGHHGCGGAFALPGVSRAAVCGATAAPAHGGSGLMGRKSGRGFFEYTGAG